MGLVTGGTNTGRASPKTEIKEDAIPFCHGPNGGLVRTEFQARTRALVQPPAGDDNDHPGRHFNMDDIRVCPALAVLPTHTATVQQMPAIKDRNLLPDIGRMTAK